MMVRGKGSEQFHDLRPEVLGAMIHWLEEQQGNLTDQPHLRPALATLYPAVLAMYSLVLITAVLTNCCLLIYTYRHRLYLYLNLGLGNLLLHCPVLPLTVVVLVFNDWLLGRTACHLLPLIQDMSTHFTVLSHLTLAIHLLRDVHSQSRMSPIVAALLVWSVALILVIPYRPNISYTDLGLLDPHLKSFGICTVKLTDHIKEYTRSVVLLAYFLPVCVMVWVYVGAHRRVARLTEEAGHRFASTDSITCEEQRWSSADRSNYESQHSVTQQCEIRVKYLGAMLIVCNACLCPLMILKIIKTKLVETADYSGHLDLLYCAFVWLGSLPTTTSPMLILYSEYRRSGSTGLFPRRRCSECKPGQRPRPGPSDGQSSVSVL